MADPIISPDGNFIWNGNEWISASAPSVIVEQSFSQQPMNSSNSGRKIKLIVAVTLAMLIIGSSLYIWFDYWEKEDDDDDSLPYFFRNNDASGQVTDEAYDNLISLQLMYHRSDNLEWDNIAISISKVGGTVHDTPYLCEIYESNSDALCTFDASDGKYWLPMYELLISEGDVNICNGEDPYCEIEVTINLIEYKGESNINIYSHNGRAY